MTSVFSSFSLKRNRPASNNKGLNAILSKLTNTFHHHKKRKHKRHENDERRSSFSILIDYFRSVDDNNNNSSQLRNHPFSNDSIFEYKRYIDKKKNNTNTNTGQQKHGQQKQKDKRDSEIIFADDRDSIYSRKNTPAILVNNKAQKNHRHTNSTISQRHTNKKSRHVRHYSHVSCISTSNITVNSENLTAKEFADIAGIRILSDDENYSTAHSQLGNGDSKILKRCAVCDELEIEGDNNVINNQSSMVVVSRVPSTHITDISSCSFSSSSSSPSRPLDADDEPQIWDTGFWCPPGTEKSDAALIQTKPPILSEIKADTNATDTIIKKGRFEIHLAPNNTCKNKSSHSSYLIQPDVVEWKRKKKSPTQ